MTEHVQPDRRSLNRTTKGPRGYVLSAIDQAWSRRGPVSVPGLMGDIDDGGTESSADLEGDAAPGVPLSVSKLSNLSSRSDLPGHRPPCALGPESYRLHLADWTHIEGTEDDWACGRCEPENPVEPRPLDE